MGRGRSFEFPDSERGRQAANTLELARHFYATLVKRNITQKEFNAALLGGQDAAAQEAHDLAVERYRGKK